MKLSYLIRQVELDKKLQGIKVRHDGTSTFLLLFADESLLFCKVTLEEVSTIKSLLAKYEKDSNQHVNFENITFSLELIQLLL